MAQASARNRQIIDCEVQSTSTLPVNKPVHNKENLLLQGNARVLPQLSQADPGADWVGSTPFRVCTKVNVLDMRVPCTMCMFTKMHVVLATVRSADHQIAQNRGARNGEVACSSRGIYKRPAAMLESNKSLPGVSKCSPASVSNDE